MSWLRENDGELGDPKVAQLSDRHYRDLHALRQWLARERPGPAGLFSRAELVLVVYPTAKGARALEPAALERFLELGLVREVRSYSARELELMGEDGAGVASVQAAGELLHADPQSLRCNRWEAYSAPLDRTRNERQARYRARHHVSEEGSGSNAVTNAVGDAVRVHASRPVTPKPSFGRSAGGGEDRADELAIARLLGLLGASSAQAEYVRGLALRSPAGELERLTAEIGAGVVDPLAYALERLQRVAA